MFRSKIFENITLQTQGPFPSLGRGGGFLSQLKNREEFEGLEKRQGKEEKKEKSYKTHVKINL